MMQTEPEVMVEHSEVICSTSVERIVAGRDSALIRIEQLIHQLSDISSLTSSIGGGIAGEWAMRQGSCYDCWLMEVPDKAMELITRNIDRSIWRDLMLKSGMLELASSGIKIWKRVTYQPSMKTISSALLNSYI